MRFAALTFVFYFICTVFPFYAGDAAAQQNTSAYSDSSWQLDLFRIKSYVYKNQCEATDALYRKLADLPYPGGEERHVLMQLLQGEVYYCRQRMDSCLSTFEKIKEYKGKDPLVHFEYLAFKGKLLYDAFQVKDAIFALHKAFSQAEAMEDQKRMSFCANFIARCHMYLDFYDDSEQYRRMALQYAAGDSLMLHLAYSGIANIHYVSKHQYDSSVYYNNKAKEYIGNDSPGLEASIRLNTASSLFELGMKEDAEQQAREVEALLPYIAPPVIGNYYNTLGFILSQGGKHKEAIEVYRKGLEFNKTFRNLDLEAQLLGFLSDTYAAAGQYKEAYDYHFRLEQVKDSLRKIQTDEVLIEKEKAFQTSIKEKENARLTAENELQLLKLNEKNMQLIGVALLMALLLVVLVLILNNYRSKQKHIRTLDHLNGQLTEQRDEILRINQLLQLKILRTQMNPHFIYNCLNSILHLVQQGEKENAANYLLRFSRLLRQVLDFSDRENISLEEEVQFLELYLSLEKLRLGPDFL
ncbi:MAG: histidine kinase, partial [Bacteroidia bacterium]|nr:histidine kinase [Bacteroidia bacterium]